MMTKTYIGLGSNLGDSEQILREAVLKLRALGEVTVSKLYQSPPMGPQDQPHYYNAVAQLNTHLEPLALLDALQRIENEAGRVRLRRWGERTLDLDLLLYAEKNIINERLTVPHMGILERDFVMVPLLDLDPSLQVNGQSLQNLDLVQHSTLNALADHTWAD
ncbi:2-amino-4-hydroxy-6-hydroxymethyldihydropteridine diphosphokinase [Acinetobacter rongchengensis]|uniref:2-amino-4-hydroxy-6-hydroxymethyldihydropteridine pyrophosphokinase n=1 Tax=Acinetobacter rongchengensis TaxID=2419601 RepID=A0A3A8F8Y2_9GAMM|nr:2-amino-4-hydroxy-6-hydroxymethyldihydropteridine diphosphokinase [Acinetobacter rongchengensis]RKG37621.1 2-amino-4-hydroxy-6-hydroxymethyldihydropteridine diphosphokinase [Acinetobacter rongchengensis]